MAKKLTAEEAKANVRESAQSTTMNKILTQIKHASEAGQLETLVYRDLTHEEEKELKDLGYGLSVSMNGSLKATKITWA